MTAIIILAVFVMAASATSIRDTSNITEDHFNNTAVPPPDVSSDQPPVKDDLTPPSNITGDHQTGNHVPTPEGSPEQPPTNGTVQPEPVTSEQPTPPHDDNPDCNTTTRAEFMGRVHERCLFVCSGDEAEMLTNNETCILYYTDNRTEESSPTGPRENITGVCQNGQCVPNNTDVTGPISQSSTAGTPPTTSTTETPTQPPTAGTTSTTSVAETSPQTTKAETTPARESSSPESPTNPERPFGQRENFSPTPGTQPNNTGPVAIP